MASDPYSSQYSPAHVLRAPAAHRPRWRRWLLIGLIAVVVLAVLGASLLYAYGQYQFHQIASVNVPGLHKAKAGKPFNVLVVGSDTRQLKAGDASSFGSADAVKGQRNDVTMVVHVDPANKKVSLLSIPRDLVVPIAGTSGSNRINSALEKGPEQLIETIQQNFGIQINHYIMVNFDGFESIVNSIGGIKLNFPYPAKDAESGLQISRAGCQWLDGARALTVARSRHYYYLKDGRWRYDVTSDFGRIERQHAFLRAMVKTALAKGLTNPLRANKFIGAVVHDLTKDSKLSLSDAVGLASQFRSLDPSSMPSYTLPTVAVNNYRGLGDVLLPKQPDDQRAIATFLGTPVDASAPGTSSGSPGSGPTAGFAVQVLNATDRSGLASRVAARLRTAGFQVSGTGNYASGLRRSSTILYAPGHLADARALQAHLVGTVPVRESSALGGSSVALVVGTTFGGISSSTASTATTQPAHKSTAPSTTTIAPQQAPSFDPQPC